MTSLVITVITTQKCFCAHAFFCLRNKMSSMSYQVHRKGLFKLKYFPVSSLNINFYRIFGRKNLFISDSNRLFWEKGVLDLYTNRFTMIPVSVSLAPFDFYCSYSIGGSGGGARPARAPPFAWHPSFWWYFGTYCIGGSRGARPARAPPFAWHPSFWWYFGTYCIK